MDPAKGDMIEMKDNVSKIDSQWVIRNNEAY
jgi:hypothetical protein